MVLKKGFKLRFKGIKGIKSQVLLGKCNLRMFMIYSAGPAKTIHN